MYETVCLCVYFNISTITSNLQFAFIIPVMERCSFDFKGNECGQSLFLSSTFWE